MKLALPGGATIANFFLELDLVFFWIFFFFFLNGRGIEIKLVRLKSVKTIAPLSKIYTLVVEEPFSRFIITYISHFFHFGMKNLAKTALIKGARRCNLSGP